MTRPGIVQLLVLAIALWLVRMVASAAPGSEYKIIVHPDNPEVAIDRQFLRDAYLRKSSDWNHGMPIRPVDLASRFAVRRRFVQDVLRKSPSQLKSYWNQRIFSGKGVPPPEVNSTAGVVNYVLTNTGAVGYLPIDADAGGAKVIKVK